MMIVAGMVFGLSTNAAAQSSELKIGFVDLQRVIDASKEGTRAQEDIKNKAGELEEQARKMQDEMTAMKTELDQQYDMLTPEARNQKRDEMSKLQRDYERFVRDSQSELRVIEQRALKQLLEELGKLVVEYGQANNFTVILEAGNILYGAPQIELTEQIIELYNSKK